jgi:ribosomal protein S6
MTQYRLILGLKPDLSADRQKKILTKVKQLIANVGGEVGEVKSSGLTKLAYPIAGFTNANFNMLFFTLGQSEKAGKNIKSLQKELGAVKEALRIMVVREEVKQ